MTREQMIDEATRRVFAGVNRFSGPISKHGYAHMTKAAAFLFAFDIRKEFADIAFFAAPEWTPELLATIKRQTKAMG